MGTDVPTRAVQSTESTIRVAVTGHRDLDAASLEGAVRGCLTLIRDRFDGQGGASRLVVLSALAEGADQLVARVVLEEPRSSLEASLPLPPGDYRADFGVEGLQRFDDLLRRAATVRTAPSFSSREDAYAWAGRDVVDRCDVLLAIWDGRPSRGHGGTAEVVAYARSNCVPVVWIDARGEHRVQTDWSSAPSSDAAESGVQLEHHRLLSPKRVDERTARQRDRWLAGASGTTLPLGPLADWILPVFVRADMLAEHFQRVSVGASTSVFVLAALALTTVAVHATFFPNVPWVVAGEFAFLVILVAIVLLSRARRWNDQWISYRYLTERLRSAFFLAVAGTSDRRPGDSSPTFAGDPVAEGIRAILAEMTSARPPVDGADRDVAETRGYLARHWIEDQARYHCSVSRRHQSSDVTIKRVSLLLFCLALGVCGARMIGLGESEEHLSLLGQTLVALSIAVPAFGAATHGIGGVREHRRQAQRSARMAELLRELRSRMEGAPDIETVREVAAATERVMREENGDWFGAMRFHEVELIS